MTLWLHLCSVSEWLAALHYALGSRSVRSECRGLLAGQIRYRRQRGDDGALYLLRRNTHRLEKGLTSRPRRAVFALDYIDETVKVYKTLRSRYTQDCPPPVDVQWAEAVLERYFAHVQDKDRVAAAYGEYRAIPPVSHSLDCTSERKTVEGTISYDDFCHLALARHSVRVFAPHSVSRDIIRKAMAIARWAPSACNRQPYRFIVVDQPDRVKKLAGMAPGTAGFVEGIPALIVVVGRWRAFAYASDRHLLYVDGSLAAMLFMLAIETVGLASCPINWVDSGEQTDLAAGLLKLDDDERIVLLMAVGVPDRSVPVPLSVRRDISDLMKYDVP